jgi:hypothetical protein
MGCEEKIPEGDEVNSLSVSARRGPFAERRAFGLILRAASTPSVLGAQTPQRRVNLQHDLGAPARVARLVVFMRREHGCRDITTQFVCD